MTLGDLRKRLDALAADVAGADALEVKVWLPGSRVKLGVPFIYRKDDCVLMEGNIETGSALDESFTR